MKCLTPLLSPGLLVGCSSIPSSATSSAPTQTPAVVLSPAESAAPTGATTSAPVAGGTATDFCGTFLELHGVSETRTGDIASVGLQFRAAAAVMRKVTPTEIAQPANSPADVMDTIGKAAEGGTIDEAALSKAIADALAGNASHTGTTAVWVATNCGL